MELLWFIMIWCEVTCDPCNSWLVTFMCVCWFDVVLLLFKYISVSFTLMLWNYKARSIKNENCGVSNPLLSIPQNPPVCHVPPDWLTSDLHCHLSFKHAHEHISRVCVCACVFVLFSDQSFTHFFSSFCWFVWMIQLIVSLPERILRKSS